MKLYLTKRDNTIQAEADYDLEGGIFTVLKGSRVSDTIAAGSFRSAKSVQKMRNQSVKDGILKENLVFKSASTAANFVTGRSTNGLLAWKTKDGIKLREALENK